MKISVITISYNSEKYIEDTIKSILSQDYEYYEYIVIDGNSTDRTVSILENYKKKFNGKMRYISEPDKGIYDAINKGISLATGEIVGLLHSDDFFASPSVFKQIANKFQEKDYDAIYANLFFVQQDNINKVTRKWISRPYPKKGFYRGWQPPHPTLYVKKDIYTKAGDYPIHYSISADYFMMLKLFEKMNIKSGFIDEVLVMMRIGGTSTRDIKSKFLIMKECTMAWTELGLKKPVLMNTIRLLRKIYQKFI